MRIEDKLDILAAAAKYDVSCASSGSRRKNAGRKLGNAAPSGICHTYTEDGRCVSLLKVLFTNFCIYDCAYCINRTSNDIPRAAFTTAEIIALTVDFYRRNYIEGLFLSSGILRSPDDTMERLVRTAQGLRQQGFNGYIHLKCVPFASRRLIGRAGLYADRLSVNIELPSEKSLKRLTREKTYDSVLEPMRFICETIAETREDRKRLRQAPIFAPAGQSTQLIVGASPESDRQILELTDRLYRERALKRVYYSAYLPVGNTAAGLPDIEDPPLRRENRLYQADWLMRLYGFALDEVLDGWTPFLDLYIDPKQAFALRHPALFPVDINTADRETILRVPGIGLQSANRIVYLRRRGRVRFEHLRQMGVVVSRAGAFIRCDGQANTRWQGTSLPVCKPPPAAAGQRRSIDAEAAPENRRVLVTDGTFEGLLTALFVTYATEPPPVAIEPAEKAQPGLFDHRTAVATDTGKADRVWNGLKKHLGSGRRRQIFEAYLSASPGVETTIYRFVRDMIPARKGRGCGAHLSSHITIEQLSRKVRREAHRMKGLVRFQQTGKNRYFALIAPRYDILPLIRRHFEARFADQSWIIYDTIRNYGLCYDRRRTLELQLDAGELQATGTAVDLGDRFSQTLWQRYFAAVNIAQRCNPKLHLSRLPRRYWRYLPEKQL